MAPCPYCIVVRLTSRPAGARPRQSADGPASEYGRSQRYLRAKPWVQYPVSLLKIFNLSTPIVLHVRHPMSPCTVKQCFVRDLPKKRRPTEASAPPQLAVPVPSAGMI